MTDKHIEIYEKSLATGSALDADSWNDFVKRLTYDCIGDGVNRHCTADPIFVVQARRRHCGIEDDYAEGKIICCDGSEWLDADEYWECADEELKEELHEAAITRYGDPFDDLNDYEQLEIIEDLPEHCITGYVDSWEDVSFHFTRDAAEAFIKRKNHDYRELRVYVKSQYYSWEFNAIRDAIINGKLIYQEQVDND